MTHRHPETFSGTKAGTCKELKKTTVEWKMKAPLIVEGESCGDSCIDDCTD
jgi:hypothetical protein